MELKQQLDSLASQLNLAPSDIEEKYILTPAEESAAIESAISILKKHKAWKMANIGMYEETILQKMASIDCEKEVDRDLVLRTANSNKHAAIWQKEMIKKIDEEELQHYKDLVQQWTADYFRLLMKNKCIGIYGKPFQLDADNRKLIDTVCFFLSRDKHFETALNLDAKKGLLIRGISGLGKTFLFELVKNNPLNPVKIVSMIDVAEAIKEDGFYHIEFNGEKIIYLDDVGTEEATVNHFGTKVNWFKDFIEKYYTRKESFKNLVISTNLNANELEEKYGSRVRSRMREMFNVIDITGKDRRK